MAMPDGPLLGIGSRTSLRICSRFWMSSEAAVLVASSSAGLTVQRFAVDHPERTLGLVFIGAPRSLRDKPVTEFVTSVSELSDPVDRSFVSELLDATLARP